MLLRKTDNANIRPSIVSEENLFFKSVSDALFQVSIPGNESYFSSLAKYNGIQTSWAGTGPFWNRRHIPGRFNCWMPSLSSPWPKSAWWLAKCWSVTVRTLSVLKVERTKYISQAFYIPYFLLSTATLNWKEKIATYKTLTYSTEWGFSLMSLNTKNTLITIKINLRYIFYLYDLIQFTKPLADQYVPIRTRRHC